MKSTIFMILMVAKYLFVSLPEYKMDAARVELEMTQGLLSAKKRIIRDKIIIVVKTILFAAACIIFLLKCFGVLPWW